MGRGDGALRRYRKRFSGSVWLINGIARDWVGRELRVQNINHKIPRFCRFTTLVFSDVNEIGRDFSIKIVLTLLFLENEWASKRQRYHIHSFFAGEHLVLQEKSFCFVSSVQFGATHKNAGSENDFALCGLKWGAQRYCRIAPITWHSLKHSKFACISASDAAE